MNYELIKNEFIKLKKEELDYINKIAKISNNKILSEFEKLKIYRTLNNYKVKINEMMKKLWNEFPEIEHLTRENLKDVIIEFDLDKDYLCSINLHNEQHKKYLLKDLGIDTEALKFKLTLSTLVRQQEYKGIDSDLIQNNQKLIENPIYIFCGYYDSSEDCYGPCFGEADDYLYGIYENICSRYNDKKEIQKKYMVEFEKDKIIFYSKRYVQSGEIRKIFEEELLNIQNKTLNDCFIKTRNRIEELNYTRSPEYKEKILLERINKLYNKVKENLIQNDLLYSGHDSVVVISITQNKEYIITFHNKIKNKIIVGFPSGYIENGEEPIDAAKRILKEETSYITDDLFIVDETYAFPEIDNSITYIVVANNCIKIDEKSDNENDLLNYSLFSEKELEYLINNNIMNGAINKLAYYNLVNNVDNCNIHYLDSNKKIYKKLKKKNLNPLND